MSLINTAVGLVALTDPVGVLPLVIQAASANPHTVRRISRLAATTYLLTLVLSCWWGQPLLDLFGISLPAFRIAGGLILLPYGLRLIEGISIGSSPMALDHEGDVRMMAVVPIGLPMLAGPGTISLVIAESPADLPGRLLLSGLIVALALVVFLVLSSAIRLHRTLGELRVRLISRLMGVLIASVATQMLVSGLRESFPVLAG
ncbi:MarC family protein [Cyanobium sp. NIES-981]|uniref:MarC family protein n=1 Tax=Cyanobium sp. NIES-981 TaxID=1851505 RepID=UPI0007DDAFB4|nr:MarC family protein [Cyanobium sp. NIES-981]SBO44727.1 Membrane protein, MarC family [Cyanobium sp. NIES-981]